MSTRDRVDEYVTHDSGTRETQTTGMQRDSRAGKGRFDLIPTLPLKRLAQLLERGALKYGDRNWERGGRLSRYLDSAMRHLNEFRSGELTEDHLAAVCFNVMALMHTADQIARGLLPADLDDMGDPI